MDYEIGELHISDGSMFFHSEKEGRKGGLDLWYSKYNQNTWTEPENISSLNTNDDEGWPFLTDDGRQLLFTRFSNGLPAIVRSYRVGDF